MSITGLASTALASPALAQTTGGTSATSWARMFLWCDDPIGLAITWGLLAMSFACLGFAIQLMLRYRRISMLPPNTQVQIDEMLAQKQYREAIDFANEDPSYLGRLVASALSEAGNGYAAMERAIEEEADAQTTKLLRPIEYLNVAGNIGPMLGLFGTVYGMIVAFQQLVEAGGRPDPATLAAGISTALVTTFWGLIVAMPALAFYALIRNKVDALTSEGTLVAEDLIRPFKPGGKKAAPAAPAKPRATPTPKPEAGESA
jgi:biopolymer transport protein ExbB